MILLVLAVAYLIGSIPFALFIGHIGTGGDIRNMGSGNAGATNVMRILGWKAALIVLSGDFLKGFLPVFFAWKIYDAVLPQRLSLIGFQIALMIFLILGHVFPLWAGFRGGKGVACAAGGISALFPPAVPFCLTVFIIVTVLTRIISLASLITAWFLPAYYIIINKLSKSEFSYLIMAFFIVTALFICLFHRSNIKRLLKGSESKIHFRKED